MPWHTTFGVIDACITVVCLAVLATAVARLITLSARDMPAGTGAMVMAIGIFASASWQHLPFIDLALRACLQKGILIG